MDKIESQVMPAPPSLITSLKAGFDAIANQIVIILIPIGIDLFLWFGPHIQAKTIANNYFDAINASPAMSSLQSGDVFSSMFGAVRTAVSQFNLLSLFRTIPVGIPSLMASRLPKDIPNGSPIFIDVRNPFVAISLVVSILLLGLISGSFYYYLVAQVSLKGRISLSNVFKEWLGNSLQVISLAVSLLILFIIVSIPSGCVISSLTLFGIPLGQFVFFLYFGLLLWLAFPLLFSAHGIFVNHNSAFVSVQRSMMLIRMTLPKTSLFFLSVLALSEGMDILWRVPPETSWLTLIGVIGHAFITSSLLAASFIYYRDADQWTQGTLRLLKSQNDMPVKGG